MGSKEKTPIAARGYAQPAALVSTEWVDEHRHDRGVEVVEVYVDTELYEHGHVPGARGWSWRSQLADQIRRDILSKEDFERLMSTSGIEPATTVVLYGDSNNWFAAWAFGR